jgi:hypothetical protein
VHGLVDRQAGDEGDGDRVTSQTLAHAPRGLVPGDGPVRYCVDADDSTRAGGYVDASFA